MKGGHINNLFSIITPTYNRAHLIKRAIQSVLNQSANNWELIIVDDGSTDNTEEIIRPFVNYRIKYYKSPENVGNANARNIGVNKSKGNYITFLDSDDELLPEYITEVDTFILKNAINSNNKTGFLWTGAYSVIYERDGISEVENNWYNRPQSFLHKLNIGIGCGVVIKKECIENIGLFNKTLKASVDTEFLIRLESRYDYQILEKPLIRIHLHEGERVHRNYLSRALATDQIIDINRLTIENSHYLKNRWYSRAIWLNYYGNNKEKARYYSNKLFKQDPLKVILYLIIFELLPVNLSIKLHKKLSMLS